MMIINENTLANEYLIKGGRVSAKLLEEERREVTVEKLEKRSTSNDQLIDICIFRWHLMTREEGFSSAGNPFDFCRRED